MITNSFLVEWAIRSSILILGGTFLIWVLRVKDSSVRLAAWTAILCSSLAIPALTWALPGVPFGLTRVASPNIEAPAFVPTAILDSPRSSPPIQKEKSFDWVRAAEIAYGLVALGLLLRLAVGLSMSLRLLRTSQATDRMTEGIEVRESDRVAAPVTLGIVRPAIVLPAGWRHWDPAKLDAVLAHERSHIRRHDPAVQLLSAIHRALLWHSPLSWFLHQRIVRVAEEASDDAAVAVTQDRAAYAQVLLDFMQGGQRLGVSMARYTRADQRLYRILDETVVSGKLNRWSFAAIVALGSPLAYVVAAAHPQSRPQMPQTPPGVSAGASAGTPSAIAIPAPVQAATTDRAASYLAGLGSVTAYTVTVKPRIDGQLLSVSFKEGDLVEAGQVLATIDPRTYEFQLAQAEGQLARDQAQRSEAYSGIINKQQFEGTIKTDQALVENARLQLNYAKILAPISGLVGLRQVDAGNIVHASDPTGIVIINQLQPIAVVFTLPEDRLQQVLGRMREKANLPVEAWNREQSRRIATGHLMAVDNQIDQASGTVKLKAEFDNKNGALFPNQFVNVRLFLK
jgi:RND family efflux transporter MFP subunit